MVYLDYSSTTPVDSDILKEYLDTSLMFFANPNSMHKLGMASKTKLLLSIDMICNELKCNKDELVFTSCASESNSMVLRGMINSSHKHILSTKLEHKSILKELQRLETLGYEVEYIEILKNGQIDLEDLNNKIRKDTVLVSICGVNSEVGYIQDLKKIYKIIKSKNKNCLFHSDLTQALGKMYIDLSHVDLASFSSHKIYAPKGCGILYKKREIEIEPLISPTTEISKYRGGTMNTALISAVALALKKLNKNLNNNVNIVNELRERLINGLNKYDIQINSNSLCIPNIINISLLKHDNLSFIHKLEKKNIFVSPSTACCGNEKSVALSEIYKDDKISKTSIRISISHITTQKEIDIFLEEFDKIY